ncbi:hypothetical protein NLI96_g2249 [Meripilus lineatus]|uniref:Uncharacterized protein n=1 Tax=Meripilus lineatus TaxID=2056292 RepID=A0AAD5VBC0_9APHY|nr:hypothetical protein NLI96_g2249 [Physisporinus lineatus]
MHPRKTPRRPFYGRYTAQLNVDDAALTFACRTSGPPAFTVQGNPQASGSKRSLDSDITLTDTFGNGQRDPVQASIQSHSYPPSPPQPQVTSPRLYPLSPRALDHQSHHKRQSSGFVNGRITQFLLTPHTASAHIKQQSNASLFTRVVSAIKTHAPSHSYSFTLSPLPSSPSSAASTHAVHETHEGDGDASIPPPIVTFHDRTPVWTVRSNFGLLELDTEQIRMLGVDISFYIACALTYLEYLGERESYLAAAAD